LSLRTLGQPPQTLDAAQAFQGAFELQGNAEQGDLRFLTPLGSTAAWIRWNPQGAELLAHGETRQFGNLAQLVSQAVGADLPIAALFSWLRGQSHAVDGWQVDLSGWAAGKIAARRTTPEPVTELRLVLDNAP